MNAAIRSGVGSARALAGLLAVAGAAHFVAPDTFSALVPRLLPGSGWFWTILSGAVEICLAVGVSRPNTRSATATLAAVFFVLVFPANVQMAIAWSSRPAFEYGIALLRLPLQIPIVWWAWNVRNQASRPAADTARSQLWPIPSTEMGHTSPVSAP